MNFESLTFSPSFTSAAIASEVVHSVIAFPRSLRDLPAASSSFTTRKPASPSLNGASFLSNAIDEIARLGRQRLRLFDLRRPHVAGAIADQQIVDALAVL